MKYILVEKNLDTQECISQKEYRSLLQMSKDLKTTYCSCYNNFMSNEMSDMKPAKKHSQVKFNRKFKIVSTE